MRFVDLSAPIAPSQPELPDVLRTDIVFQDHADGAAQIENLFGVPARLLRDGEGWATETFTRFGTHNSTHVDAPWHYNSTIGGERAQTIDELPLEWFLAPGMVVEASDRDDGEALTAEDMAERVPRAPAERDIVLVRTGRDAFYGQPDYIARGPGVTAEATHWLYERGVRVMGIDAWGWDAPLHLQAERARAEGRPGIFWAAHQAGLAYSQIERLVNLAALPPDGFTVSCFPLRLVGGSAAPARVVADVPG
jgi:kynurenine formamidase